MVQAGQPASAALPPPAVILNMVYGLFRAQLLYVAAELRIADHLAGGPKPVEELARLTGAHAPALRRVLRALAGEGVFAEDGQGRFGLTPAAELLRGDGVPRSLRAMARFYGSSAVWQAWGGLLEAVRTGRTAFEAVHGTALFPYLAEHPADAAVFNDFMTSLPLDDALAAYAFAEAGCVVDVGGGHGSSLIAVLRTTPDLRGVLLDLPAVAEGARGRLAEAGLSGRCEVVGGDFFVAVPPGGDVYLLSNILHDWDDVQAARILRRCREAMADSARLVVVEAVVPAGNTPHPARLIDIQMLVTLGGVQRTEAEFRALLTDGGFRLTRVILAGPVTSLIEAVPA